MGNRPVFQLVYVVETQQYSKKPQCTTSTTTTTTTTTTAATAAAIVTTPCNTTDSRDARVDGSLPEYPSRSTPSATVLTTTIAMTAAPIVTSLPPSLLMETATSPMTVPTSTELVHANLFGNHDQQGSSASSSTAPLPVYHNEQTVHPYHHQHSSTTETGMAVQPEYSQLLESAMTPQCEINSELLNTHNDSKQQAIYYALYPSVAIDALACPLCFHVPNRAKLLPCCQYMICGPCARLWLHPSHSPRSLSYDPRTQPLQPSPPPPSCPFCRAVVSTEMALSGLPDATATQQVLDWMDVLCPYSNHGCSWVGPRRDILVHMKKKCIIGVDPETGTPALGALDIADFCLEETWIPHGIPIPTTSSPSLHPSLASVSVDPIATSWHDVATDVLSTERGGDRLTLSSTFLRHGSNSSRPSRSNDTMSLRSSGSNSSGNDIEAGNEAETASERHSLMGNAMLRASTTQRVLHALRSVHSSITRVAFPAHRLSHHSSHDDIDHSSDDLLRGSTDRDATGGVMQVLPSLAGDPSYNGTGMTINMSAREQTHPVLDTVPWVPRGMQRCWKSIFVGVLALGIFILALMVRRDISAY
ncbi:hypothetical protein BASA62_009586 [Batrachochytrium salamandrivorans]|nr:hypothetical protein BASA62_009586 [Batrachochytrium salamandrivorans]